MVQQFADIGGTRDQPLQNPTESLEDRAVVDRGKEELDLPHIHIVFPNTLFQFDLVIAAGVGLREVDVGFVDEHKHAAIIGVLAFEVFVDVVEGVSCLCEVRGGREHVDQGRCVLEDHLLIGRRFVDVVLGWEVVEFELYLLYFEVVALHLAGFAE